MKYVNNDCIRSTGKAFPSEQEYCQGIGYDAMNRPVLLTQPDDSNIRYTYNKASLPETVELQHLGTGNYVPYVTNINYNEKGQRTDIYYGNGSKTRYDYDAKTFRLTRLLTTRNTGQEIMQDLNYVYDPVGNIVEVYDYAPDENGQTTYYYANTAIEPGGKYEYDALYRLINARGRELASLNMPDYGDFANNIPLPGNNTMQNYQEQYSYDALGNILSLAHYTTGQTPNWTRDYVYETQNNRLKKHDDNQSTDDYSYDVHGNMLTMPHLSGMGWDYADQLHSATNGTFTSYYNYDSSGTRSRKVVEKGAIREERYYFGGYEVYRKYVSGGLDKERHSLHVDDDKSKVAIVETLTRENGQDLQNPQITIRYQYSNHLGSACLELDAEAQIISYEEYHPFGTTSYRAGRSEAEVSLKRYKYCGKERDEESGLYYYGMRYYADWLCRFVSVDPLQFKYPELTPFQYASNAPITFIDLDGAEGTLKKDDNVGFPGQTRTMSNGTVQTFVGGIGWCLPETVVSAKKEYYISPSLQTVIQNAKAKVNQQIKDYPKMVTQQPSNNVKIDQTGGLGSSQNSSQTIKKSFQFNNGDTNSNSSNYINFGLVSLTGSALNVSGKFAKGFGIYVDKLDNGQLISKGFVLYEKTSFYGNQKIFLLNGASKSVVIKLGKISTYLDALVVGVDFTRAWNSYNFNDSFSKNYTENKEFISNFDNMMKSAISFGISKVNPYIGAAYGMFMSISESDEMDEFRKQLKIENNKKRGILNIPNPDTPLYLNPKN